MFNTICRSRDVLQLHCSIIPLNRDCGRSWKIYHFGDGSVAWGIFSIWIQHDMPSEHALLWGSAFNLTKSPWNGDTSFSRKKKQEETWATWVYQYCISMVMMNPLQVRPQRHSRNGVQNEKKKAMEWLHNAPQRLASSQLRKLWAVWGVNAFCHPFHHPIFKRPAGRTCDTKTSQLLSSTQNWYKNIPLCWNILEFL